jgi:hypothetical protein
MVIEKANERAAKGSYEREVLIEPMVAHARATCAQLEKLVLIRISSTQRRGA